MNKLNETQLRAQAVMLYKDKKAMLSQGNRAMPL